MLSYLSVCVEERLLLYLYDKIEIYMYFNIEIKLMEVVIRKINGRIDKMSIYEC